MVSSETQKYRLFSRSLHDPCPFRTRPHRSSDGRKTSNLSTPSRRSSSEVQQQQEKVAREGIRGGGGGFSHFLWRGGAPFTKQNGPPVSTRARAQGMLISRLLGAPLVWSSRGIALPHSDPVRCSPAVKMLGDSADAAQSYAGIFAESTGITKAWSLPGEGCETLLLQRTARNIEGGHQHSVSGGVWVATIEGFPA